MMTLDYDGTLSQEILHWHDSTPVRLAQTIAEENAFDRMPILADALEEAGCIDQEILTHCRSSYLVHSLHCWVLDLLLGRQDQVSILEVDYDFSIEELIEQGGYSFANPDININNFPSLEGERGKQHRRTKLYHFNQQVESDDVIAQMAPDGIRPATTREILAYGKANPEVQREFPVVGLGQTWLDPVRSPNVIRLWGFSRMRFVNLGWYDDRWNDYCRFLGVSK